MKEPEAENAKLKRRSQAALYEYGERVIEKRVARLMRVDGLRARPRKRF